MKSFQCRFLTLVHSVVKVLLLSLVLVSCNDKDDDEQSPVIDVQFPQSFDQISSIDTIPFLAYISDNKQVTSVYIDLLTLDFEQRMPRQQYDVSGSNVTFATDLLLNEPFLESGTYYIVVRASDGVNESATFIEVHLVATERVIESFIVVTNQGNATKVHASQDLNDWTEKLSLFSDARGAALNYRQGLLGICGGEIGDAVFYDITEFEPMSSIPGFGTPSSPYFLGLEFDAERERFYLYQNDPRMRVLDKTASGLYGVPLQVGHRPEQSFRLQGENFVEEKSIADSDVVLAAYSQAGSLFTSYAVNGDVISLSEKSQSELFMWLNTPSGVELSVVNTSSDLIASVYNRVGETLLAALELGPGIFLISTDQGLYRYNYNNGGTTVLNPSPNPTSFYLDDLDGLVYATEGNTLYIIMSQSGQVFDSHQFPDPILEFAINYNR